NVRVCEEWFLMELLDPILAPDKSVALSYERFNQLMLACGRSIASERFYSYFFKNVATIETFEDAVENFRVKAMWLFGNFKFAYKKLAARDLAAARFDALVGKTEARSD